MEFRLDCMPEEEKATMTDQGLLAALIIRDRNENKKILYCVACSMVAAVVLITLPFYLFFFIKLDAAGAALVPLNIAENSAPSSRISQPREIPVPKAHLTAMARSLTSSEEVENQFLLWEHQHGQAFLKNGLDYQDNALVFPISGDYFVYAQVTFREIYKKEKCEPRMLKQTITKVTDKYPVPTELATASKSVCETGMWVKTIYVGAIFHLDKGDRLKVNVSSISLVDLTSEKKTFFGAYLLQSRQLD
ncbi:tumor necrosis factor ligand superfamily member 15-like [Polyodon spathula]|uniref:tumor necrosis factor ligand superfamily member 15-like n=1 Tax=Polyodon spathula TaxID=7913 RepID=UPI001B7ECC3C|nr:tumor necrosis factor ligand superfamily member 15-like [Polyodon spathula]